MHEPPAGMRRNGRPVDPTFEPGEKLYLRVIGEHIDGSNVLVGAIRLPSQSVNREKYSHRPEWVLYPKFFDWGIAVFLRQNVPDEILSPGNVGYRFMVEHVPEEQNYPHSEVRAYKSDNTMFNEKLTINDQVKKKFRMRLAETMRVLLGAGQAERPM